jgi:hypothetical protein
VNQKEKKAKNEPKHQARFRIEVDIDATFEQLEKANLHPLGIGPESGVRTVSYDSPLSQISVTLKEQTVTALISTSLVQISYVCNDDLPSAIWQLQPFIIEAESHKPVENLAAKLEYTTLTERETDDIRKALMVTDFKMMYQLEKNRMLTAIFLSLISELRSLDDSNIQDKIKPILKRATDLFSKLNA